MKVKEVMKTQGAIQRGMLKCLEKILKQDLSDLTQVQILNLYSTVLSGNSKALASQLERIRKADK